MRTRKAIMDIKENDDYISDMKLEKSNRVLVATSGDGTLTAFDIRKHKMKMQSELFESDLLNCVIVKVRIRIRWLRSNSIFLRINPWGITTAEKFNLKHYIAYVNFRTRRKLFVAVATVSSTSSTGENGATSVID